MWLTLLKPCESKIEDVTNKHYHSNGKLLITGEYLVLRGAKALALPLKYGQNLEIMKLDKSRELLWRTYVRGRLWFEAKFDQELNILDSTLKIVAIQLQKVLKATLHFRGVSAQSITGHEIRSDIDFDINWGWGSSSSLISNIGYWLQINPFQLLFATTNGSGYDVAAARSEKPIFYHLKDNIPNYESADFAPSFKDSLYFVYLGQKQKSANSVQRFNEIEVPSQKIDRITELTDEIINANDLDTFERILEKHNSLIAGILDQPTPKSHQFSDFDGVIKPLGAWGGDFILVTSRKGKNYVNKYFAKKGKETLFTYSELVKN